jgi:predicted O-methyltransferase YrrM
MFSIPINPKFSNEQYTHFLEFCKEHKDVIYDLYFTCRMPPFMQDAMGDVFEDLSAPIEAALDIQRLSGIRVSATFNNIQVPPTQDNLDLFIMNFRQLYAAGVRSATIPHTHWIATGQIQKEFPELLIKNTILRHVETAKDVAALGKEGFHYVNIHRDLMRDQEALKRIRKAADKYNMKVALLANEGCAGGCSMMNEHFQFNNTRTSGPQYFNDPISRVSCPKWDVLEPAIELKKANIPPWREDWVELLKYVDVFKMHGRESINRMYETMDLVKKYHNGDEILYDDFNLYLKDNNLEDRPINAWRKIIKTCKFDCWDCNFCEKVYNSKSQVKQNTKSQMIASALVDHVNSDYDNNTIGLSSSRVKKLLHTIGMNSKQYLEIGSAMGSTAISVLDTGIPVTVVDNWEQDIASQDGAFDLPENTKNIFLENTKAYSNLIDIHDCDLFSADLGDKKYDFFMYDGPHDEESTASAVEYYSKWFDSNAVLVFDDANWAGVISGAAKGISRTNFNVVYSKMLLNSIEDQTKWWNGLYIMVIEKNENRIF